MKLIICGISSLAICSWLAEQGLRKAKPCRVRSLRDAAYAHDEVLGALSTVDLPLAEMGEVEGRLHVLVGKSACRYKGERIARHLWSGPLPDGALYGIGGDVYVTSPEFSLVLLGPGMPFEDLVALCCEACGTYMRDETRPKGFYERPALTSVGRIERLLLKLGQARGTAKLRRALRYALNDARSPMETAVALLMSMPTRLGGYGLPKPVLNHREDLGEEERRMSGRSYMEFDIYFPEQQVAVEYDSDENHTGARKIASDARRANTARYLGFAVITVTWGQVRSPDVFDGVVQQVARELGKRLGAPSESAMAARRRLRMHLLPPVQDR